MTGGKSVHGGSLGEAFALGTPLGKNSAGSILQGLPIGNLSERVVGGPLGEGKSRDLLDSVSI